MDIEERVKKLEERVEALENNSVPELCSDDECGNLTGIMSMFGFGVSEGKTVKGFNFNEYDSDRFTYKLKGKNLSINIKLTNEEIEGLEIEESSEEVVSGSEEIEELSEE